MDIANTVFQVIVNLIEIGSYICLLFDLVQRGEIVLYKFLSHVNSEGLYLMKEDLNDLS